MGDTVRLLKGAHEGAVGVVLEKTGGGWMKILTPLGTVKVQGRASVDKVDQVAAGKENAVTAAECAGVSLQVRFTGISNAVGSLIFFQGSNCQANTPARGGRSRRASPPRAATRRRRPPRPAIPPPRRRAWSPAMPGPLRARRARPARR